ncbi:MAG TPA: glycosyltransferase family 39 protein [Candidatus Angelobacter sp.]|nr:glycosyltransferase family 39 protein [Candidatus Angelobacter sp.]
MLKALREFRIGRPQIVAGLMLLAFLAQCLWVAAGRRFSDLEYNYMASGFRPAAEQKLNSPSPLTGLVATLPLRSISGLRKILPESMKSALAVPRTWLIRLPFIIFGLWLGGALWWVARRLYGNAGGYVALALYCFSPAMVMISSNIGPEIILAWSSFGLIYTAIGVAHTVYAPPRKWLPRILILGAAIGICLATALWAFSIVLLAFVFMLYLSPGRRRQSVIVLLGASLMAFAIVAFVNWMARSPAITSGALIKPRPTYEFINNLGFIFADAYWLPEHRFATFAQQVLLILLIVSALTTYGSWGRTRYFGNTAPLITAFSIVLLFALVPAIHIWDATLGLSFAFLFIGGIAADLLETSWHRLLILALAAILVVRIVLGLRLLGGWIHQNPL